MNLSLCQGLCIAALDVYLRIVLLVGLSLNVLMLPFALFFSALYLPILLTTNECVKRFNLRARTSAIATGAISNILYLAVTNFTAIAFNKTLRVTSCYNYNCRWVDGSITWLGVQGLALDSALAVFANAMPLLLVYVHAVHCREEAA
jgi:hypothetical protein